MTPRLVAASTSTLSTPTPARATTFRFFAAARTSAVTFVSERIMSAWYEGICDMRSEGERPFGWSMSKCGERRARPSGETFSGMRILGRVEAVEEGMMLVNESTIADVAEVIVAGLVV